MDTTTEVRTGGCHGGAVRFEATLADGLGAPRRCNCSFRRMHGAVVVMTVPGGVRILDGTDHLTRYRFDTRAVEHVFCARCGIDTHHQRRSDPSSHAVNVACLDGASPFDVAAVPVADGMNHPNDTGGPARLAGTLRFEAAD